jgi:thiol-disulfide isomerase/thioredoxin/outer membrane lipoprotein-sorting protein
MSEELGKRSKSVFGPSFLLILFVSFTAHAQTLSTLKSGQAGADALPFLTEIFAQYAHSTSYHLEYTEERKINSEFTRHWSKAFITSIGGPANRYRFERRGEFGTAVQVSDGVTEWIYYAPLNQYTQQPTPGAGPSEVLSAAARGLSMLRQYQSHVKNFATLGTLVRTATFLPEQTIEVAGNSISCIVITTEGERPDTQEGQITTHFTFWIDKRTKLIRKSTQRTEGELTREPGAHYVGFSDLLYQVAELNLPDFPEGTFRFAPPPSAVLVKEFEDKQTQDQGKLVGKPVPPLTLKDSAGKEVTLQSFVGKPVLLDFWATWCAPCRESLPTLEKLYQQNETKGLVLLSLDEDDDNPQRATDFWSTTKEPWPNFHADKEIRKKFPSHGIPYFILVDASGKVVLSYAGFDENILRNAVAAIASTPTSPSTN